MPVKPKITREEFRTKSYPWKWAWRISTILTREKKSWPWRNSESNPWNSKIFTGYFYWWNFVFFNDKSKYSRNITFLWLKNLDTVHSQAYKVWKTLQCSIIQVFQRETGAYQSIFGSTKCRVCGEAYIFRCVPHFVYYFYDTSNLPNPYPHSTLHAFL